MVITFLLLLLDRKWSLTPLSAHTMQRRKTRDNHHMSWPNDPPTEMLVKVNDLFIFWCDWLRRNRQENTEKVPFESEMGVAVSFKIYFYLKCSESDSRLGKRLIWNYFKHMELVISLLILDSYFIQFKASFFYWKTYYTYICRFWISKCNGQNMKHFSA